MNAVFEKATRHITRSDDFLSGGLLAVGLVAPVAILAADLAGTGDAPTVSRPVGKVDTPASAAQGPAVTYYIVSDEDLAAKLRAAADPAVWQPLVQSVSLAPPTWSTSRSRKKMQRQARQSAASSSNSIPSDLELSAIRAIDLRAQ